MKVRQQRLLFKVNLSTNRQLQDVASNAIFNGDEPVFKSAFASTDDGGYRRTSFSWQEQTLWLVYLMEYLLQCGTTLKNQLLLIQFTKQRQPKPANSEDITAFVNDDPDQEYILVNRRFSW